jgi:hypothetical protein
MFEAGFETAITTSGRVQTMRSLDKAALRIKEYLSTPLAVLFSVQLVSESERVKE